MNNVNRPKHYVGCKGLEVEEVLRNFLVYFPDPYIAHRAGSAVEYILRAPRKNGVEDLKKAKFNLEQAIKHYEEVIVND